MEGQFGTLGTFQPIWKTPVGTGQDFATRNAQRVNDMRVLPDGRIVLCGQSGYVT